MTPDLRLYALVDPEHTGGHDLADLTRAVARGGATLVQLRDKVGSTRQMIERARALVAALTGSGVPLIVNDRVDVALAAGAGGVHVGQDDMAVADARRLLGRDAITLPAWVDKDRVLVAGLAPGALDRLGGPAESVR